VPAFPPAYRTRRNPEFHADAKTCEIRETGPAKRSWDEQERTMRAIRVALITAGLMAAGAVFGAVAGVAAAWMLMEAGFRVFLWEGAIFLFAAFRGAELGAVLGPAAAWLLMRHVPLGLAVGGTTVGAIAGGALGLLLGGPGGMFPGGIAGFALSALFLRIRVPSGGRLLRGAGARLAAGGR
jgi:hypothetical protein